MEMAISGAVSHSLKSFKRYSFSFKLLNAYATKLKTCVREKIETVICNFEAPSASFAILSHCYSKVTILHCSSEWSHCEGLSYSRSCFSFIQKFSLCLEAELHLLGTR